MITSSELFRKIRREVGDKIFSLLPLSFYEEVIVEDTLMEYSEFYPELITLRITKEDCIPHISSTGNQFNAGCYRLPALTANDGLTERPYKLYRDIEDYNIPGNETDNAPFGGNMLMNQLTQVVRSNIPHIRSYYSLRFEGPNTIFMDPEPQYVKSFTVTMMCEATLTYIPRTMQRIFFQLAVAHVKYAIYNRFKHTLGTQIYGGVEINNTIETFEQAKGDANEIIAEMKRTYFLNPERFAASMLYSRKQ